MACDEATEARGTHHRRKKSSVWVGTLPTGRPPVSSHIHAWPVSLLEQSFSIIICFRLAESNNELSKRHETVQTRKGLSLSKTWKNRHPFTFKGRNISLSSTLMRENWQNITNTRSIPYKRQCEMETGNKNLFNIWFVSSNGANYFIFEETCLKQIAKTNWKWQEHWTLPIPYRAHCVRPHSESRCLWITAMEITSLQTTLLTSKNLLR